MMDVRRNTELLPSKLQAKIFLWRIQNCTFPRTWQASNNVCVCIYACMYVCLYACMTVYMYISIYLNSNGVLGSSCIVMWLEEVEIIYKIHIM